MPIRTNRGRAAVYRRLWGWPLRSPKHLVVLVSFLFVIGFFLGYVLPKVTGSQASQNSSSSSTTTARPSSKAPTVTQGAPGVVPPVGAPPASQSASPTATRQTPSENKTPAKADPKALEVATKWAEAFVKHDGVTPEQWLNALRPFTTDEYLAITLTKIDPQAIAAKRITGAPLPTADSYTSSVVVQVPMDVKKLTLTLIKTTDGWRVDEHGEVA